VPNTLDNQRPPTRGSPRQEFAHEICRITLDAIVANALKIRTLSLLSGPRGEVTHEVAETGHVPAESIGNGACDCGLAAPHAPCEGNGQPVKARHG
jgi:hypothetical protein